MRHLNAALTGIQPVSSAVGSFVTMQTEPAQPAFETIRPEASLVDRWDVLDEYKDYPHMLTPLEIMKE